MKLFAPESYKKASEAEKDLCCNGCGSKGLGGLITPDTLYGLPVTDACNIHDWMYKEGATIADKNSADRAFLNNMLRMIDDKNSWTITRWLRRIRATNYYSAVRDFGGPAFWDGK